MSTEFENAPDQPTPREHEEVTENDSPKLKRKISRGPSFGVGLESAPSPPKNSPDKPFTPKGSLFKMTQSRMAEVEVINNKMKDLNALKEEETLKRQLSFTKEQPKPSSAKKNVGPSERLLKTTQARIIDTRELELRQDRIKESEDIWWDIRKAAQTAAKRPDIPSKLYEPTVAYLASNRTKHPLKAAPASGPPETPEKEHVAVQKIDDNSPLLKPTRSSVIGMYGKDLSILEEVPSFQPTLVTKTDNVHSKVLESTRAAEAAKYKSKEQIAQEEAEQLAHAKAAAPKVAGTSERLVTLNSNLKAAQRTKVTKTEADPREDGWKKTVSHTSIPEPEPVDFSATNRRYSNSPAKVNTRRTSKVGASSPAPNGHSNGSTEAVAPTETPEEGMDVEPETHDEH